MKLRRRQYLIPRTGDGFLIQYDGIITASTVVRVAAIKSGNVNNSVFVVVDAVGELIPGSVERGVPCYRAIPREVRELHPQHAFGVNLGERWIVYQFNYGGDGYWYKAKGKHCPARRCLIVAQGSQYHYSDLSLQRVIDMPTGREKKYRDPETSNFCTRQEYIDRTGRDAPETHHGFRPQRPRLQGLRSFDFARDWPVLVRTFNDRTRVRSMV